MTQAPNRNFAEELLKKWTQETAALKEMPPRIPLSVLCEDAIAVANVIRDYWEPSVKDGVQRRGLAVVEATGMVHRETAEELRELQVALMEAQDKYMTLVNRARHSPMKRGQEVLRELQQGLKFLLATPSNKRGTKLLRRLRRIWGAPRSGARLALSLTVYARLAEVHLSDLTAIAAIDEGLTNEARQLAHELSEGGAARNSGTDASSQRELRKKRDRLVAAIHERISSARRAIRFVFKNDKTIIKRIATNYKPPEPRAPSPAQRADAPGSPPPAVE